MGKLIYSSITSLDGYVADRDGRFDWAEPDEEVHRSVNDLSRSVGTFLLGRGMYEVLVAWETLQTAGQPSTIEDFAQIWKAADKVVYSTTLEEAPSARTTIERRFEVDAVRRLKKDDPRDVGIGGPGLAAQAIRAGLVDEYHLFLVPVVVGGGTPFFPDDVRVRLGLDEQRRFGNGTVLLRYRAT